MPPILRSGKQEGFAYSLSRWTDLPAAKWAWFRERLLQGQMLGVSPLTGVPGLWSLHPEDTLGMIFWTRDGRNLVRDSKLLEPYKKVIHFTLTGWQEVEHKAPQIDQGLAILGEMVQAFGADNITWRFSPVPTHPEALERFKVIAEGVQALGIKQVYVSFLQNNDRLRDDRSTETQRGLLEDIARLAPEMAVLLCNENKVSVQGSSRSNLRRGVCEDGRRFSSEPPTEGCGCALAVDPFTVNESCHFGCEYCYAADKTLAPKKFNTTKALPVVR